MSKNIDIRKLLEDDEFSVEKLDAMLNADDAESQEAEVEKAIEDGTVVEVKGEQPEEVKVADTNAIVSDPEDIEAKDVEIVNEAGIKFLSHKISRLIKEEADKEEDKKDEEELKDKVEDVIDDLKDIVKDLDSKDAINENFGLFARKFTKIIKESADDTTDEVKEKIEDVIDDLKDLVAADKDDKKADDKKEDKAAEDKKEDLKEEECPIKKLEGAVDTIEDAIDTIKDKVDDEKADDKKDEAAEDKKEDLKEETEGELVVDEVTEKEEAAKEEGEVDTGLTAEVEDVVEPDFEIAAEVEVVTEHLNFLKERAIEISGKRISIKKNKALSESEEGANEIDALNIAADFIEDEIADAQEKVDELKEKLVDVQDKQEDVIAKALEDNEKLVDEIKADADKVEDVNVEIEKVNEAQKFLEAKLAAVEKIKSDIKDKKTVIDAERITNKKKAKLDESVDLMQFEVNLSTKAAELDSELDNLNAITDNTKEMIADAKAKVSELEDIASTQALGESLSNIFKTFHEAEEVMDDVNPEEHTVEVCGDQPESVPEEKIEAKVEGSVIEVKGDQPESVPEADNKPEHNPETPSIEADGKVEDGVELKEDGEVTVEVTPEVKPDGEAAVEVKVVKDEDDNAEVADSVSTSIEAEIPGSEILQDGSIVSEGYADINQLLKLSENYFGVTTYRKETPDQKMDRVAKQTALIIAKESGDPMYSRLVQAAKIVKTLKEECEKKYAKEADEKSKKLVAAISKKNKLSETMSVTGMAPSDGAAVKVESKKIDEDKKNK